MTDLNDLLVTSPDLNEERLETLKRLFPDLFTNEGKLNPVELKRLFEDEATIDKEQYTFTWRGKGKAKKHAFMPSRAALTYDPERSVNPGKADGNMIIEGENLEVLKLLTSAYREQVKCIYIDPPYNTGGDFIYPDNYSRDKREYWEQNGSYHNGIKLDTNPETSGRYHSDWLSMMYSRLLVARQVLRDDGVIFVSIDDNEVHNLRKLMDEVFGEENFIGLFVINSSPSAIDYGHIAQMHDYALIYAKDLDKTVTYQLTEKDKKFKYTDAIGPFNLYPLYHGNIAFNPETRPNLYYPFYLNPDKKTEEGFYEIGLDFKEGWVEVYPVTSKRDGIHHVWRWGKAKAKEQLNMEIVGYKTEEDEYRIVQKTRHTGKVIRSLQIDKEVSTRRGTRQVEDLFGAKIFTFPKSVDLIKLFVTAGTHENDLVLDFFAGSGTTAQAVMEVNKEEGGRRRFVLVQLPEEIGKNETAYKAGYRTISQITIERCKRVVQGYGDDPQPHDTGFKVYRLTKSHFPRAEFQPDPDKSSEENVKLLKQYIAEKESSFHIAFEQDQVFDEVLLKYGFKLDYKLAKHKGFSKNAVYLAEEGDRKTFICLDTNIAEETIDFFKTHNDTMFICLERALDTTKKWNLNHTLGERLKAI